MEETEAKVKSKLNLRKLMAKLGMGTNEFAEACGVSSQSMAQFLRPGKSLTTTSIYKLASALDIDPRDMFFPEDEERQTGAEIPNDGLFSPGHGLTGSHREGDAPSALNEVKAAPQAQQSLQSVAFCPHCGAKVRVGVVLMED